MASLVHMKWWTRVGILGARLRAASAMAMMMLNCSGPASTRNEPKFYCKHANLKADMGFNHLENDKNTGAVCLSKVRSVPIFVELYELQVLRPGGESDDHITATWNLERLPGHRTA